METTALLSVIAATAVNSAMPGPCMILIAAQTAQFGPRSGFRTSLGTAAAQMIYAAAAVGLLALAMTISDTVLTAIRYAAAGVLAWLAIKMLARSGSAPAAREMSSAAPGADALVGFGVGLSSPFNLVFMLSILPQYVSRDVMLDPTVAVLFGGIFCGTMGPKIATIWIANRASSFGRPYVPLFARAGAILLFVFAGMSIISLE